MSETRMNGANVTITGGTGSFGSTMVRHLLTRGVNKINILSRDEAKQDAMRRSIGDDRVKYFVGDVRDVDSVSQSVSGADFVFHAAALKQVPSCEFFPDQAVRTNVLGSRNVIEQSHRHGVSSVVCLSTDKAVYPVNAMGMSKALMEKTVQAFARNHPQSKTIVSITRYGNVLYSRGSVVPLFVEQLRSAKDITITDAQMTRFLMSLEQSVDLVDYAFTNAEPGDLFVRKAPACTVLTLAQAVAELLNVHAPKVTMIGTRHGEKQHETLLSLEERKRAYDEGDYFRVPLDARGLQYDLYFTRGEASSPVVEDYNSSNTFQLDVDATKALLMTVPEMALEVETVLV